MLARYLSEPVLSAVANDTLGLNLHAQLTSPSGQVSKAQAKAHRWKAAGQSCSVAVSKEARALESFSVKHVEQPAASEG
jgi:hypothetical protein